jgi:hypothetical protein
MVWFQGADLEDGGDQRGASAIGLLDFQDGQWHFLAVEGHRVHPGW